MANKNEPNSENEMMTSDGKAQDLSRLQLKGEKGAYGETLRPSEREDSYSPTKGSAEGERSVTSDARRLSQPNGQE